MKTPFKVVIPARYGSTRLPGKPLLDIAGKPMIAHVCQRALEAHADEVVVATDDERVFHAVEKLGIQVVMTDPNHQSGTDRIAEVAHLRGWQEDDIIVNLQGDEPLIPPEYIQHVAYSLSKQSQANIATLAIQITDIEEVFNPNAVKVIKDKNDYALYFSRAPIPWDREQFRNEQHTIKPAIPYLRHIGLYAYTVYFLQQYCLWQQSPLETVECLEQLRILWHGESILVETVAKTPPPGVDTEEDLQRVRQILSL
jgi:3-deoxy-manno-octulosonate cytidylyltransferase (CMP-KDO synthetase)